MSTRPASESAPILKQGKKKKGCCGDEPDAAQQDRRRRTGCCDDKRQQHQLGPPQQIKFEGEPIQKRSCQQGCQDGLRDCAETFKDGFEAWCGSCLALTQQCGHECFTCCGHCYRDPSGKGHWLCTWHRTSTAQESPMEDYKTVCCCVPLRTAVFLNAVSCIISCCLIFLSRSFISQKTIFEGGYCIQSRIVNITIQCCGLLWGTMGAIGAVMLKTSYIKYFFYYQVVGLVAWIMMYFTDLPLLWQCELWRTDLPKAMKLYGSNPTMFDIAMKRQCSQERILFGFFSGIALIFYAYLVRCTYQLYAELETQPRFLLHVPKCQPSGAFYTWSLASRRHPPHSAVIVGDPESVFDGRPDTSMHSSVGHRGPMPRGVMPPGMVPQGMMPPSMMPPGMPPPGPMLPGMVPPGMIPAGPMPLGMMPPMGPNRPGMLPGGMAPPQAFGPGPIAAPCGMGPIPPPMGGIMGPMRHP